MNLGLEGEKPEFDNFSWFSMMFGAGIGVGMLTWAVAEPISHFQNNPDVIRGSPPPGAEDNIMTCLQVVLPALGPLRLVDLRRSAACRSPSSATAAACR